jgi:hypothetical protein
MKEFMEEKVRRHRMKGTQWRSKDHIVSTIHTYRHDFFSFSILLFLSYYFSFLLFLSYSFSFLLSLSILLFLFPSFLFYFTLSLFFFLCLSYSFSFLLSYSILLFLCPSFLFYLSLSLSFFLFLSYSFSFLPSFSIFLFLFLSLFLFIFFSRQCCDKRWDYKTEMLEGLFFALQHEKIATPDPVPSCRELASSLYQLLWSQSYNVFLQHKCRQIVYFVFLITKVSSTYLITTLLPMYMLQRQCCDCKCRDLRISSWLKFEYEQLNKCTYYEVISASAFLAALAIRHDTRVLVMGECVMQLWVWAWLKELW